MVQSVKLIYTRIILFLRWAIYILLLFGLFHSKHITGTKIINFDSTVLIVFIGIYYIGVTFLTFYYDKDIKNYIVIFIDFLVGALVFLTYPITVNSLPPVHITMLFALPIFETGLLSKKKCLTATILSILVFCGLMEYAKIKYAKELPNFVLTSDFVYVVVFFLVIYLFVSLFCSK